MSVTKRRRRIATTLVAAAGIAGAVLPASALAVAQTNACRNSATANNSQITVDTSADSPASVAAGAAIPLTNIKQSGFVPGTIFAAGYNLGVLHTGENQIPTDVYSVLHGDNTVEGNQTTNTVSTVLTTTISDPDGTSGTGDETATDATFNVTYNDMTYTAGATGPATFRQASISPPNAGTKTGSFIAVGKLFGGAIKITFACTPGTVTGPDPGVPVYIDPAATFATTAIVPVVTTPTCFGVSGDDLNQVETANGTAYVSDGVTTTPNAGAKAGEQSFNGTSGDDVIIGSPGKDYVRAGAGNDKVCTLAGNDRALGEKGNDSVDGGDDNDGLYGGPNDDTLNGGNGNDAITGQKGNDALDGGAATDKCDGGADTDTGVNCETLSNIP